MSQRRRAITLPNGEVIFDVIGADPGDEDEQDEDEDESTEEDDEDEDESEEEEPTIESLQAQLAEEVSKRERAERRMKAADKAKAKEVARRQALEAPGRGKTTTSTDGDEDTDEEKEQLKQQLADLQRENQNQRVFDAFRDASPVSWHNDRIAFKQLDLSEVVDDEGAIDKAALKDAIKDLTKDHGYLVKPKEGEDEDTDGAPRVPSGNAGSGRTKRKSNLNRDALTKKFPSLQNRG